MISSLFLSHGAPNMALHDTPVRKFMVDLGNSYPKPDAIIAVSAHFETTGAVVVSDPNPGMIYDFRGFEQELYNVNYPAPGNPELAQEVTDLVQSSGLPVRVLAERGFDHGTWVPFSLVWPQADIPIVQLSIDPDESAEYHYRLGRALAPLAARNILVVGTGNITHNLQALFAGDKSPEFIDKVRGWVDEFLNWVDSELDSGNSANLLEFKEKAPYWRENHPTDEHFLPIFVAMGAAGKDFAARKIHESVTYDFLAMDAWEFRPAD